MLQWTHTNKKQTKKTKINEQTKPNKTKHKDIENKVVVTRGEGGGEKGEGDQLHGDRWKLNFWW